MLLAGAARTTSASTGTRTANPKGEKRDFGAPKDSAQESFTDTDSRIMKRAGGGYDYSSSELNVALGRQGKQALEINAQEYPHTAAMDAKLRSPQVRAVYRKRKWIVEAPNGWVKSVLGFRQFSLRGGSLHGSSLNSKFVHNDSKLRESDL